MNNDVTCRWWTLLSLCNYIFAHWSAERYEKYQNKSINIIYIENSPYVHPASAELGEVFEQQSADVQKSPKRPKEQEVTQRSSQSIMVTRADFDDKSIDFRHIGY